MAADEGFYSFFGKGRCGAAHLPGTELQVEEKPIKARNKNDKRVFIKQETERVNIYHVGLLLCRLGEQLRVQTGAGARSKHENASAFFALNIHTFKGSGCSFPFISTIPPHQITAAIEKSSRSPESQ